MPAAGSSACASQQASRAISCGLGALDITPISGRRGSRPRERFMAETMTGGCACGRVRYTAQVHDDDAYLCHCRMCQRATGSVSIAFKSVKQADVAWAHEPDWYDSSPIAARPYCRECGTSLGFKFREGSEEMDLTEASFD